MGKGPIAQEPAAATSASIGGVELAAFGGEFHDRDRERQFRADRFAEMQRNARLLFALSVLLNSAFLLSDWRFVGTPHFYVAVPARLVVIVTSVLCFFFVHRARSIGRVDRISIIWEWIIAICSGLIMTSGSDIALFVVLLLPSIFYLTVPLPFRWTLAGGVGVSVILYIGYLIPGTDWRAATGLALAVMMLNAALVLVVTRANRLERLQWATMLAERRTNARLRESQEILEKTFQAVPVPLVVTELKSGRILKYNETAMRYYGDTERQQHVGACIIDTYVEPAMREDLVSRVSELGFISDFEARIRLADGSPRHVLIAASLTQMEETPCIVGAVIDLSERLAAEEKVRHAATHDALTGLLNRAAFQDHLEQAFVARRLEEGICLVLIDLDGLKDVNDTLGHDAGDVLLVETAHRLMQVVSEKGFVARLGGDEFVLLVRSRNALEDGRRLAQAINADLRRPVLHHGRRLSTRASIGIAACPEHDCTPTELMKDADLALYTAKQQGRNRSVLYAPAMRQAVSERVSLARDISGALADDQIVPYYQPKFSLATGRLAGFEALARWRRNAQAVLTPTAFETAMADPELALLIGERMTRRVASDVRGWQEAGLDCGRVAINISPAQFTHRDLAQTLLRHFHAAGVEPENFDVEITETVFLGRSSDHVAPILDELYRAGVRIALDDFGTGYAALTHLKQLPIDTIKIDQSFVKDIEQDAYDTAIVCAVIELGRNLGMAVIAEGVETAGQGRFLKARGCEFAQGFFFSRPVAGADVAVFLRAESDESARARLALIA